MGKLDQPKAAAIRHNPVTDKPVTHCPIHAAGPGKHNLIPGAPGMFDCTHCGAELTAEEADACRT